MDTSENAAAEDHSGSALRRRKARRRAHVKKIPKIVGGEESAAEVEQKIVTLQKIVPGGETLPVEELFEETADYIFALETQIKALRCLAAFVQSSEKKKRKLGG